MKRKRDWFGLDVDNKIKARKVKAILLGIAEVNPLIKKVEMRTSSGRRGKHFKVHLHRYFTMKELLAIRRLLFDCSGRVNADEKRLKIGRNIDILFYFKNSRFATKWRTIYSKPKQGHLIHID